jgi:polysaccharide biosynthesis PFTS motif protein
MKKVFFFIEKLLFGFNYKKKILKTHDILKQNNGIEKLINDAKDSIEEHFANKNNSIESKDYELSLTQFVFKNLINNKFFNEKLIFEKCFLENFYYPLPLEYLQILKKKGFKINFLLSKILWNFLIFIFLIHHSIKIFINYFLATNNTLIDNKNTIIYLSSMPKIDPNDDLNSNLPDFYNWFANFFYTKKKTKNKIIFVHENKKIKNIEINSKKNISYEIMYVKNFLFRNLKTYKYILSIKDSFLIVFEKGWDKILILDEIIKYKYISQNIDNKPDYALFNMSNMTFQPLWSKLKNVNNEFMDYIFYYSTNIIPLVEKPELTANIFGYRLHSWNNYILWNKNQKNWIEYCSKKKINSLIVNDYIPFEGKNINILKNYNKKIVIFDVQPRNDYVYYNFMHVGNIYTLEYCTNFFLDITESIKKIYPQAEIIYKVKRDIKTINKKYLKLVTEVASKIENFKVFHDEISAQSLIKACDASISIPFTSTALIADYLKKPSIYYHPSHKPLISSFSQKNDNQINNKLDLETWLKTI